MRKKLKVEDYPEISPKWIRLINKCEFKLRYAEITIITQDGKPVRIKSGVTSDDLSKDNE